ncbi:MAG TPA: DUF2975 domain-containing protein, partial [Candidatus Dormibacteraeota bacterium]|nr:DUF2975 domain-containing protein [Candidatus Dormibacteraeota bacterium]
SLLYFVLFGCFPFVRRMPDGLQIVWGTYATFSDAPLGAKLIVVLGAGLILAVTITCYQLLNLFEKGIIFSARNVRLLGRIGCLSFAYGFLRVFGPAMISAWFAWIGSLGLPWNFVWFSICAFLTSPWIIGGFFLFMISHIMDEGRKIQEEQDLTV